MRETELQPHRVRWDRVDGRRVRSLEAGTRYPVSSSVVIIPGLGALGYLLDTLDGCSAWARSFLLDVPGFGHSPPRPCSAEVPAIAQTVTAWIATVADAAVVLVGHSTGAQAALHVAVSAPDLVRALVLLGPTFPPHLRRVSALASAVPRNFRHEAPGELRAAGPYYLRGGLREVARAIRSGQRDQPEHMIGQVSCSTLLVRGEHDVFAPQPWLDRLAAAAPHSRSVTVPGAHNFPYQHGGLTAALIASAAVGDG
jgi:pimeloyl-ACP methyl ester carboxylesterase